MDIVTNGLGWEGINIVIIVTCHGCRTRGYRSEHSGQASNCEREVCPIEALSLQRIFAATLERLFTTL
jgi:hypothetical protein